MEKFCDWIMNKMDGDRRDLIDKTEYKTSKEIVKLYIKQNENTTDRNRQHIK